MRHTEACVTFNCVYVRKSTSLLTGSMGHRGSFISGHSRGLGGMVLESWRFIPIGSGNASCSGAPRYLEHFYSYQVMNLFHWEHKTVHGITINILQMNPWKTGERSWHNLASFRNGSTLERGIQAWHWALWGISCLNCAAARRDIVIESLSVLYCLSVSRSQISSEQESCKGHKGCFKTRWGAS